MVQEEIRTRTYEELIINRIVRAFEIMDNSNHPLAKEQFDEIIDEIEMLLQLVPDLGAAIQKRKYELFTTVKNEYALSEKTCSSIENEYLKEIQAKKDEYEIEWGYRKDMLEAVLNILNQYQLIPFSNPSYAEIEPTPIIPATIEEKPTVEGQQLNPKQPEPSEIELLQSRLEQLKQEEELLKAQEEQKRLDELRNAEQVRTRRQVPPKQ